MALFANMATPLHFESRETLLDYFTDNIAGYGELQAEHERIDKEFLSQSEENLNNDSKLYSQWRAELRDGAIDEEEYRKRFDEIQKQHDLFFADWREATNKPTLKMKGLIDKFLRDNGFDGIILDNDEGSFGRRTTTIVALSPNQVKSATDNNGSFSEENDDIRFSISNENNEIFVSNAERAVEGIRQEKATPQQWRAMLEKQGGLKAGEDKWIGLSDWLHEQQGSVSKQQLLDYIREHKIQIEEVEYGDAKSSPKFREYEEELRDARKNIEVIYKEAEKEQSDFVREWNKRTGYADVTEQPEYKMLDRRRAALCPYDSKGKLSDISIERA